MKNPDEIRIAVILPVYNASPYLKECLDSLLDQEHQNFVVFAINDGSTDNSENILNEYGAKHNKLSITHTKNGGVSVARNLALKQIEEDRNFDLVTFCDSDDIVAPNLLSLYAQYKSAQNADFITVGFKRFYKSGIKTSKRRINHPPQIIYGSKILQFGFSDYLKSSPASSKFTGNICLDAHKISGLRFDPTLRTGEDQDFRIRSLLRCEKSIILSDVAYFYRIRKSSLSHDDALSFHIPDFSLYINWLQNLSNIPPIAREVIENETLSQWQNCVTRAFRFGVIDQCWPRLYDLLRKIKPFLKYGNHKKTKTLLFSLGPTAIKFYFLFSKEERRLLQRQKEEILDAFD